ncbi:Imm1 family immunity protein [Microbacterium sp. NPDC058342]
MGDESYVPKGSLVPLDRAAKAIRAFHEDPLTREPSITWIRGSELSDPFD